MTINSDIDYKQGAVTEFLSVENKSLKNVHKRLRILYCKHKHFWPLCKTSEGMENLIFMIFWRQTLVS
jgi:hypothetical protein